MILFVREVEINLMLVTQGARLSLRLRVNEICEVKTFAVYDKYFRSYDIQDNVESSLFVNFSVATQHGFAVICELFRPRCLWMWIYISSRYKQFGHCQSKKKKSKNNN